MSEKRKSRKFIEHTEEIIDGETGELQKQVRRYSKSIQKDRFMMVFLEDMTGMLSLDSAIEIRVLAQLWKRSEFDTNRIYIVKSVKAEIAEELNYKFASVQNTVSKLTKKNLLIREAQSTYYLNPTYFFKGSDIARASSIDLHISYQLDNEPEDGEQPD